MPSLNRKSFRGRSQGLTHGRLKRRLKVLPSQELEAEKPVTDPLGVLVASWGESVQRAVVEKVAPVLAERDEQIAALKEQLRLERIKGAQADRLSDRAQRGLDQQVVELRAEIEAQERHIHYLRQQLTERQPVVAGLDKEAMAEAIVEARRSLGPEASLPAVTGVTPEPTVDLQAVLQPLFDGLVEALRPPAGEVEIVRDDRGNVTGARRKPPKIEHEPFWPS